MLEVFGHNTQSKAKPRYAHIAMKKVTHLGHVRRKMTKDEKVNTHVGLPLEEASSHQEAHDTLREDLFILHEAQE